MNAFSNTAVLRVPADVTDGGKSTYLCADVLSPQATPTYSMSGAPGASPFAAAAALPDAVPALPAAWQGVCQWVMGGRVALWDELFEKAFLQVTQAQSSLKILSDCTHPARKQVLFLKTCFTVCVDL